MDFRFFSILLVILFFGFIVSCNVQDKKAPQLKRSNQLHDSILFESFNKEYLFIGKRLYPTARMTDSALLEHFFNSEIIAIERVNKSLFVFINNDLLYSSKNKYFPPINDSLITSDYSNYYNIQFDDAPPYYVYLENEKDFITLTKEDEEYIWESAIIQDSILAFWRGVKIGDDFSKVWKKLGLPVIEYDNDYISIYLRHASSPYKIWYKDILEKQKQDKNPFQINHGFLQAHLFFKNQKLKYIHLEPYLGYGRPYSSVLNKLK